MREIMNQEWDLTHFNCDEEMEIEERHIGPLVNSQISEVKHIDFLGIDGWWLSSKMEFLLMMN